MMPERSASEIDWVASTTAQLALRSTFRPLADLVAEKRMAKHQPGLVEQDQARRAGQALLNPPEEIGEHGDEVACPHVHQFFISKVWKD